MWHFLVALFVTYIGSVSVLFPSCRACICRCSFSRSALLVELLDCGSSRRSGNNLWTAAVAVAPPALRMVSITLPVSSGIVESGVSCTYLLMAELPHLPSSMIVSMSTMARASICAPATPENLCWGPAAVSLNRFSPNSVATHLMCLTMSSFVRYTPCLSGNRGLLSLSWHY